ncbi:ribbon-helix-helix protein, CopG family [Cupriavidus sp. CuC1]|uniref:ribbon-helix-helix protein, CopG family n=1 Tax=Cupriavidus sp. CuC1 TaxID=3373131 RepID=UPI0037CFB7AC
MSSSKLNLRAGRPSDTKRTATLADLADKTSTVRVNFDLDRDLHTKLKVHAAKAGRTVSEILREMVAQLSD